MLSEWPLAERTPMEWDEAADRVAIGLEVGRKGRSTLTDDELFVAPLPQVAGEEQNSNASLGLAVPQPPVAGGIAVENKMSKDRGRDRSSFQELAKLASTPPPSPWTTPHTTMR